MEHWQSFLALVNMIMFCTGIPGHYPVNETTSSLTLTFWYTLQVSGLCGAACPDPALQAGLEALVHGGFQGFPGISDLPAPHLALTATARHTPQKCWPCGLVFLPPVFRGSLSQPLTHC